MRLCDFVDLSQYASSHFSASGDIAAEPPSPSFAAGNARRLHQNPQVQAMIRVALEAPVTLGAARTT